MKNRTVNELAKQLAEMKWGDSFSELNVTANEAHELGKAYVALRQQIVADEDSDSWIKWAGGECPCDPMARVEVRLRSGDEGVAGAISWGWVRLNSVYDIVAYRIVSE